MRTPSFFALMPILGLVCFTTSHGQTQGSSTFSTLAPQSKILTPKAPETPRINGPSVFGVRPGSPFLYTIPATGRRPMEFSADGLPSGLTLNRADGRITGVLSQKGEWKVTLHARNAFGGSERAFRIVAGEKIALTPPMGWNSYNSWGADVTQEKVLQSARAIVEKGLRDHGWTYVNVDDHWQGTRGGHFNAIQPNTAFPDIKGLSDTIHGMGLKFGIYSTPWRGTYEGHIGSSCDNVDGTYGWITSGQHNALFHFNKDAKLNWVFGRYSFVEKDVAQFAAWGVDYLKYDWFPIDVPHVEEMSQALRKCGRDVVFSLSNTASYDLASEYARLANAWRTTGDIRDTWKRVSQIGFAQDRWAGYAGPGAWNDPDMLVVGRVGGWGKSLHPTRLTPDEQYTHISLWCLLSAPLLIGCDVQGMDDFTFGLLTNDEVLAIDQDALGRPGTQIANNEGRVVYAKPLEDGSVAVGLFNCNKAACTVAVSWGPWGDLTTINGKQHIRDLWRQTDLGTFNGKFQAMVPPHGVLLLKLTADR